MKKAMPAGRQGFTLVELLVSIAIIATLTAILLPNFMGARERAKDTQKIQDMNAVKNALRAYYNDNQAYPTPIAAGTGLGTGFSGYLPSITNLGYGYTYEQTNNGDGFNLCVPLDVGKTENNDSWNRCGTGVGTTGICGQTIGTSLNNVYVVCAN